MKGEYKYFVSFVSKTGFCAQVITSNMKIRSGKDLELITAFIQANRHMEDVVITNFILLDKKWGFWDWLCAIADLVLLVFCILCLVAWMIGVIAG